MQKIKSFGRKAKFCEGASGAGVTSAIDDFCLGGNEARAEYDVRSGDAGASVGAPTELETGCSSGKATGINASFHKGVTNARNGRRRELTMAMTQMRCRSAAARRRKSKELNQAITIKTTDFMTSVVKVPTFAEVSEKYGKKDMNPSVRRQVPRC
jgi:hypothetical protein